jgi:hypothetical protein
MSVSGRLYFRVIEILKFIVFDIGLVSFTLLCVSVVDIQPPTYGIAQCRSLTFSLGDKVYLFL